MGICLCWFSPELRWGWRIGPNMCGRSERRFRPPQSVSKRRCPPLALAAVERRVAEICRFKEESICKEPKPAAGRSYHMGKPCHK